MKTIIKPYLGENECNKDSNCFSMINRLIEYFEATSIPIKEYLNTIKSRDLILAILHIYEFKSTDDYFNKVFSGKRRNEFRKTVKKGYYTKVLNTVEYNSNLDFIFDIHTSKVIRQGEMNPTFYEYPKEQIEFKCPSHHYNYYGIFSIQNKLVGYIQLGICGEVGDVVNIFGHGSYLKDASIMINLWYSMIDDILKNNVRIKFIYYHLMEIGNEGLQRWKKSVGLQSTLVNT